MQYIFNTDEEAYKKELIDKFLKRVDVYDDRFILHLYPQEDHNCIIDDDEKTNNSNNGGGDYQNFNGEGSFSEPSGSPS